MLKLWYENPNVGQVRDVELGKTLIIPCRNEISNLPRLKKQIRDLENDQLEVILINDHSEDDTGKFLESMETEFSFVRSLHSLGQGKKAAISQAVSHANGEVILMTDADCEWSKDWIQEMIRPFGDEKIKLVAGPVLPKRKNIQQAFFEIIDWASILLTTKFSFQRKLPLMCSAANLAFRKKTFEEVGGYLGNEDHLSGDDEFLLKKIVGQFGVDATLYLNHPSTLIRTLAQDSFYLLWNQRVRWASKWKLHEGWFHKLSALSAFFIQLFWILSLVLVFIGGFTLAQLATIWAIKFIVEGLVLSAVLRFYDVQLEWHYFILTSLLHPVFVILVAFGTLSGKFEWRGRTTVRNTIFTESHE